MIVDRLSVEGFKMIGERIDLTFPAQGRIGIFGGNETGKTTLLQSVEYSLYGLKRGAIAEEARENIVSWGKPHTDLLIEFTCGDSKYRLTRRISVDGRHTAKLVQLTDGDENSQTGVSSLTEIDRLVEQVTGMDRDSFTKLVFIKQKDLDALRDLAKAKREELLNKVMGIDIFDTASERIRQDTSSLQNELSEKRVELEVVTRNRDAYKEKAAQRKKLKDRGRQLREEVALTTPKLAEATETRDVHEWLAAYDATNKLMQAKRGELNRIEAQLVSRQGQQAQLKLYEDLMGKHAKKIEELSAIKDEFSQLEHDEAKVSDALEDALRRRDAALSELGLSQKDRGVTREALAARKNRSLLLSFLLGLTAIASFAGAFVWNLALLAPACIAASLAVLLFGDYNRTDQVLARMASASALEGETEAARKNVNEVRTKLDELTRRSGFTDSTEAEVARDEMNQLLSRETGYNTLQELRGAYASLKSQLEKTTREDLERSHKALADEIRTLEQKGRSLLTSEPPAAEGLQFTEAAYVEAKKRHEELRKRVDSAQSEFKGNEKLIEQVDSDLSRLNADFERTPTLEAEVNRLESRADVLSTARQEIWETGKELREKVIPQAKLVINQVLPTLTDGRYSDFDVTEDLKFKVFSVEAGDYKEREVFSGGTQDQFLIALRLAFTQTILDSRVGSDRYSLFMDECISSSDYGRRQGIFEVLDSMRATFSQIFVVAHEDISDLVDHHLVLGRDENGYTEVRSKSW
jgi:exonuclease SbcC